MGKLAAIVTGPRSRWVVIGIWLAIVAVAAPLSMKLPDVTKDSISDFVPSDSQSAEFSDLREERFEGGETSTELLVYHREGGLTPEDQAVVLDQAARVFEVPLALPGLLPFGEGARPDLVSESGDVALVIVPLQVADQRDSHESIIEIREILAESPEGLDAHITGQTALQIDGLEIREDADPVLFAVTAGLVLTLLMAIYRSPVIAFVPLITVGIAYTVATGILYLGAKGGMTVTGTSRSLLLVLMFGAVTDYCLLLVARYVEDLRATESEATAMSVALPRAGPAILASGFTVIGALLALTVASVSLISSLGPVNAIGLAVGLAASLTLLPALITVFGRRGFWPSAANVANTHGKTFQPLPGLGRLNLPSVPFTDQHPSVRGRVGIWRQIGTRVLQRPVVALLAVVLLLGVGAIGLIGFETSGNTRTNIKSDTDGTEGFELIASRFPAGLTGPATVLLEREGAAVTDADFESARVLLAGIPDIGVINPPEARSIDGQALTFSVVAPGDPFSNTAIDRVLEMRAQLTELPEGLRALVGGAAGIVTDYREGTDADFRLMIPLILGVIFLILCGLLRAIVAPLYLIGSVLLSFFGILGFSLLVLKGLDPGGDFNTAYPVFAFIFLVALGVDYNIFLMDRVREEAAEHGTKDGALKALVATGPVITSAGLILAGTFGALITVPDATLFSLGLTVAFGVLIDTFLVRTLLVPAVVAMVGDRSWWPSKLTKGHGRSIGGDSGISRLQSEVFEIPDWPPKPPPS